MSNKIDDLSRQFLEVVQSYGGRANTSEIRTETGMSKSKVQYRFRKLSDMGWIEIERAEEGKGDRTPPKVAVLTEKGEQAIRKGLAGGEAADDELERVLEVSKARFEELEENIERVENKVNGVLNKVDLDSGQVEVEGEVSKEELEQVKRDVDRLRETVQMVQEAFDSTGGSGEITEDLDTRLSKLEDDLDLIRPRIGLTEIYMRAMRNAVSDELDIDMRSYLEDAEEDLLEENQVFVEEFVNHRDS